MPTHPDYNVVEMDPWTRTYHGRGNFILHRENKAVVAAAKAALTVQNAKAEVESVRSYVTGSAPKLRSVA